MRNLKASFLKRIYGARANPAAARRQFGEPFWTEENGERRIACRTCPKFDAGRERCTVPFGTPIRKCIVASIEAHMHDAAGKDVLEIGFGTFTLPKNLVLRSGGTWTGIEPRHPDPAKFGKGGYGHAGDIPFDDQTFDFIYGIQSLEHWVQLYKPIETDYSYADYLKEVHRVLKPGGSVYFDVPIHIHGNEMFIVGDLERIRGLFDTALWTDVTLERWRYEHEPLAPFRPWKRLAKQWDVEIVSYPAELIEKIRTENSAWILVLTARKPPT